MSDQNDIPANHMSPTSEEIEAAKTRMEKDRPHNPFIDSLPEADRARVSFLTIEALQEWPGHVRLKKDFRLAVITALNERSGNSNRQAAFAHGLHELSTTNEVLLYDHATRSVDEISDTVRIARAIASIGPQRVFRAGILVIDKESKTCRFGVEETLELFELLKCLQPIEIHSFTESHRALSPEQQLEELRQITSDTANRDLSRNLYIESLSEHVRDHIVAGAIEALQGWPLNLPEKQRGPNLAKNIETAFNQRKHSPDQQVAFATGVRELGTSDPVRLFDTATREVDQPEAAVRIAQAIGKLKHNQIRHTIPLTRRVGEISEFSVDETLELLELVKSMSHGRIARFYLEYGDLPPQERLQGLRDVASRRAGR